MSSQNRESPRWAMLADDLTGACDAGAAFAVAGFRARVVWREDAPRPDDAELLVISTETRAAPPDEASETVRRIVSSLAGRRIVYKKIDSVLRGPVEAEIAAVVEAGGFQRAVVCPALPEQGRTVRSGRLLVDGEPLEEQPPVPLADAENELDLRDLARELRNELGESLAVGSAGLAFALAHQLSGRRRTRPVPASAAAVAVIIGSHHPVALAQLDYLRGAGEILETTPAGLEHVERDCFTAIVMREVDESAFEPLGRAIEAGRIGGLVTTGGATARVMLDGVRAGGVELCGELERGVPWGRIRGGAADGTPIVTKSGGFGSPDCLGRAWRALRPETT